MQGGAAGAADAADDEDTNAFGSGGGGGDGRPGGARMRERDRYGFKAKSVDEEARAVVYTRNGRPVRDGGGVEPDVKTTAAASPKASSADSVDGGVLFEFAGRWEAEHGGSAAAEFVAAHTAPDSGLVSPRELAALEAFAREKTPALDARCAARAKPRARHTCASHTHTRPLALFRLSRRRYAPAFDALANAVREDYPRAGRALDAAKATLGDAARGALAKDRAELRTRLEAAILARYLPESAVRRHALAEDMQVREALAVLTTPGRYDEILRPPASVVADVRLPPADGRPSGA